MRNLFLKIMASFLILTISFFLIKHEISMLIVCITALFMFGSTLLVLYYCEKNKIKKSLSFIDEYNFPDRVISKFKHEYPKLNKKDLDAVINGLKQFFMVYAVQTHKNRKGSLLMPSKVADELWHQFMLSSRDYNDFCQNAFGKFLHHTPGDEKTEHVELSKVKKFPLDLMRTYQGAKDLKSYGYNNLLNFTPVLFALDNSLSIEKGYHYDKAAVDNLEKQLTQAENSQSSSSSPSSSGSCGATCSSGSSCGGGCGD